MKARIKYAFVAGIFCIPFISNAQMGSIIAPTQVTFGFASAWQPKYATGIGIGNQTDISMFDFFAKDLDKPGFRLRDNLGAHTSLGLLTHPELPTISTGTVSARGSLWYDVGFNLGLQALFGFSKDAWISMKAQMLLSFNNSAYYEYPFPYGYVSKVLTAGLQISPLGFEIGKGWADNKGGPNWLSFGASLKLNEKAGRSNMFGVRYIQHQFEETTISSFNPVTGAVDHHVQMNYFFSVFYAFCI